MEDAEELESVGEVHLQKEVPARRFSQSSSRNEVVGS